MKWKVTRVNGMKQNRTKEKRFVFYSFQLTTLSFHYIVLIELK